MQPSIEGRTVDWTIESLPRVEADAALVRSALEELLSNALKFTRDRERTTIRIRSIENNGEAASRWRTTALDFG